MEFSDVLARRRMVRNYTDDPVERDDIERIVAAGQRAPSAGNTRGQSFIVVTDSATRSTIAQLAGEPEYVAMGFDPWISRAPLHIIICTSETAYRDRYREPDKLGPDGDVDWPAPYWWVDAGAALMAVLLATVDCGLSAGFLGVHAMDDLETLLGLPGDQSPIGVVTIGHGTDDRRSGSLDRTARPNVHWEHWSNG